MDFTIMICSSLLAQANAAAVQKSFLSWAMESLGTLSGLTILLAGVSIFAGACFAVAKSRRPAVIASCLVLLPLPLLVGICGALKGQIASLSVLAASPEAVAKLSGADIAGGVAAGLLPLFVALMVTWPSYLVLAAGLIVRTAHVKSGSPE